MNEDYFISLQELANKENISRPTMTKRLKEEGSKYPIFRHGKFKKIPVRSMEINKLFCDRATEANNVKPLSIVVGNKKGGSGKTTTAVNIAVSYAFYGFKVLLVDMDTQSNASSINKEDTKKANNFKENNITRLLLNVDKLNEDEIKEALSHTIVNVENKIFTNNGKLDLLPNYFTMDEESERFNLKAGSEGLLDRLLRPIESDYDVIIIDTSPKLDVMWRMSIMATEFVLINLKPDKFAVDGLGGVLNNLAELNSAYKDRKGYDVKVLGTAIVEADNTNACQQSISLFNSVLKKERERGFHPRISAIKPFITSTSNAKTSLYFGGAVLFDEPTSQISGEYLELAYNIYMKSQEFSKSEG